MNRDRKQIQNLRESYEKLELNRSSLDVNPIVQFEKWFNEALNGGVKEPNIMTLSTVNAQGIPSSRIVLLKDLDEDSFVFYTNQESDKGKDITNNNHVALLFFWSEHERQIRIQGTATKVNENQATEYFQSRPRDSQIGAWSSYQSEVLINRSILENRVKDTTERYINHDVLPKPPFWGGYLVKPSTIEFWQGRASRLHDRFKYEKHSSDSWKIHRLSP